MKTILSISVGSSHRDHTVEAEFMGETCRLSRMGTNGDFDKALELYREHDGKVDAFGVGGTLFYLQVGRRRYYWRDVRRIREAVRLSKIGDGNRVKPLLARRAFAALERHLREHGGRSLRGMKALMTTAVDRYGMAEAMVGAGCRTTMGDFMFALGLPFPLHSLRAVRILAGVLLPIITRLPYAWFYPLGEEQERQPRARWQSYYHEADLIGGDFLQIRDYMPEDLSGKIIVTNTTTREDVAELARRGLEILVTTTPRLAGRSFGTNVIEALALALIDKPQAETTDQDLMATIEAIPIQPTIEVLGDQHRR
jgi:hypothetical protein